MLFMRLKAYLLLLFTLLVVPLYPARAYWPTTFEENLPVGADPELWENYNTALPCPNGNILVVFRGGNTGQRFQIIDHFGELVYTETQLVTPDCDIGIVGEPVVVSDGFGGALVVWKEDSASAGAGTNYGIVAQRIDSLGNIIWGGQGVLAFPLYEHHWDICMDGDGGVYLAVATQGDTMATYDVHLQKINGDGSTPWGSMGIPIVADPSEGADFPEITSDGSGGSFVVWHDSRTPGGLFAQHFDSNGITLWPEDLLIIDGAPWMNEIIYDGEGGFLLHMGSGGSNWVYRYDQDGHLLWTRDHVSWNPGAHIMLGDSGYFYLGYHYANEIFAQKMDIYGNIYWPSWPSSYGALVWSREGWEGAGDSFSYTSGYICAMISESPPGTYNNHLFVQCLDTSGNQLLGRNGVYLFQIDEPTEGRFENINAIADEGGVTAVFDVDSIPALGTWNIYGKHIYWDGSFGGPLPVTVAMTPENPPVQIPPEGGTFSFNVVLTNEATIPATFDVWTAMYNPLGNWLEPMLGPVNLTYQPGFSIDRDRNQDIYNLAPPGEYLYECRVGIYPDVIWSTDSFTFVKLDSGEGRIPALQDEFAVPGAFPNPFNAATTIRFSLPEACRVRLEVFDVKGRNVGFGESRKGLTTDLHWYPAGIHEVTFDGSGLASGIYFYRIQARNFSDVKKMVLVK
jgi:hypothetical protein